MFPNFDQPDLKAKWKLTATVPENWVVISNERESKVESQNGESTYFFPYSAKISTYLYALVAGPYEFIEQNGNRIYTRKGLIHHVLSEEMFLVTQKGLEFYSSLFGHPYPFSKYDQVFIPKHIYVAMENVGCVTFSEKRYLFREEASKAQRLRFAISVLHEMAHMWFGNLVTMKWWNDLWLNESFATYLSFVAMS